MGTSYIIIMVIIPIIIMYYVYFHRRELARPQLSLTHIALGSHHGVSPPEQISVFTPLRNNSVNTIF